MTCVYRPPANAILTADGCQVVGTLAASGCCAPDPCHQSLCCALMGQMVKLLPNGPMWDAAKAEALASIEPERDCHGIVVLDCDDDCIDCNTLAAYALYSGRILYELIQTALIPALRGNSPATALGSVLDDWLDRYGWENCFRCRDQDDGRLGPALPIEEIHECGLIFAPVPLPENLECAVKRGIALAMTRLDMAPLKNLCGINWVIEPLGATIRPYMPDDDLTCCRGARFEICPTGTIEACQPYCNQNCDTPPMIPASFPHPTSGIAVWPALYAAQCIALSMLPDTACDEPAAIVRCPSHVPPIEVVDL